MKKNKENVIEVEEGNEKYKLRLRSNQDNWDFWNKEGKDDNKN